MMQPSICPPAGENRPTDSKPLQHYETSLLISLVQWAFLLLQSHVDNISTITTQSPCGTDNIQNA